MATVRADTRVADVSIGFRIGCTCLTHERSGWLRDLPCSVAMPLIHHIALTT